MKIQTEVELEIARYIKSHPERSYREIGEKLGCHTATVYRIAKRNGISRQNVIDEKALDNLNSLPLEGNQ